MLVSEFISWAVEEFERNHIYLGSYNPETPHHEALNFLSYVLKTPLDQIHDYFNQPLSSLQSQQLHSLVKRRTKEKFPGPYLTNNCFYYGLKFFVDEYTLIPRSPIFELIQQQFKPWLQKSPHSILDLGTGTGCLAIGCAKYCQNTLIDAVDISEEALLVAKANCELHECINRIHLIQSDLFLGLTGKSYDLILCNPPYLDEGSFPLLPREFQHEPKLALISADNGLAHCDIVLKEARKYLNPKGLLIMEVGNQKENLLQRYPELPFIWLEFKSKRNILILRQEAFLT